jgi:hypothetical protein
VELAVAEAVVVEEELSVELALATDPVPPGGGGGGPIIPSSSPRSCENISEPDVLLALAVESDAAVDEEESVALALAVELVPSGGGGGGPIERASLNSFNWPSSVDKSSDSDVPLALVVLVASVVALELEVELDSIELSVLSICDKSV